MRMQKVQFDFLITYLKKENINIDLEEFKFQVETHPDFPSLYAFSDTLSFFKIDNLAARVENEDIDYLPDTFIALLQPEQERSFLAFVEKKNNQYVYIKDNKKATLTQTDFTKLWKNIVLVVEQTEHTIITDAKKNKTLWPVLITLSALITLSIGNVTNFRFESLSLLTLIFSGIYLTFEALKQVFGVDSSFASAVCGTGVTSASNCESVITSKNSKLFFNISLSDLSVIFFFGQLITLYAMSISGYLQNFLNYSWMTSLVTIPVILYSIYYQWRIEKQWCTICLLIIGVFVLQTGLFAWYGSKTSIEMNILSLVIFLFGFIITALLWSIIQPTINSYFDLKSSQLKGLRFKRNYSLFKSALIDSKQYDYSTLESSIQIGNPNAKLKISMVTNLFCSFCVEAHKNLEYILARHYEDILVNIRFSSLFREGIPEKNKDIYFRLLEIYFDKGEKDFIHALGIWFNNKDLDSWFRHFGKTDNNNEKWLQLLQDLDKQNLSNELQFTPAYVIDKYLYPSPYQGEDLIYFIGELIDDDNLVLQQHKTSKEPITQFN